MSQTKIYNTANEKSILKYSRVHEITHKSLFLTEFITIKHVIIFPKKDMILSLN